MKKLFPLLIITSLIAVSCIINDSHMHAITRLSKVVSAQTSETVESCTWDSLGRLKMFSYKHDVYGDPEFTFNYGASGRVDSIHCNYNNNTAYAYYLLNWKNERELNYMDFYYKHNAVPAFDSRYTFTYDNSVRCTEIRREGELANSTFYLEWEYQNLTKLYSTFFNDTTYYINNTYGKGHGIYYYFPEIPLMYHMSMVYYYFTPNNIEKDIDGEYDYEYNKASNEPTKKYIIKNGKKEHIHSYVYVLIEDGKIVKEIR